MNTDQGNSGVANIVMGGLVTAAGSAGLYFGLFESAGIDPFFCGIGGIVLCFGLGLLASRSPVWRRRFVGLGLLLWGILTMAVAVLPDGVLPIQRFGESGPPTGLRALVVFGVGAVVPFRFR